MPVLMTGRGLCSQWQKRWCFFPPFSRRKFRRNNFFPPLCDIFTALCHIKLYKNMVRKPNHPEVATDWCIISRWGWIQVLLDGGEGGLNKYSYCSLKPL